MPTRFVETNGDKAMLVRFIESQPLPFAASITRGGKRSLEQNRLQRLWLNEISEQMGDRTPEEIRGYCKLHFGVPILRDQDEVFREKYDKAVKPLPYEQKLAIMTEPLDLPVTRLMTTKQHSSYLDAIHKHFSEQGIVLTDPEALSHNYNSRSSDTPSPSDENGSDGAPPPPESSVAADLSEPAGGGSAEEGAIASETASKAGHGGQSAPSSGLSPEDRAWLVKAVKMLVPSAAPGGDPGVVRAQYAGLIKAETPRTISDAAIAKAVSICKRLVAVCEQSEELDRDLIAGIAGCDPREVP